MGFYKNDATPANNTSINGIGVTGTSNPTNIDNAIRELAAQGAQFARDIGGSVTVGGTADAISLTLNDTVANAYFDGMMVGFVAGSDNTSTAPTANVNSIGAKVIKKAPVSTAAETALAAGDIQAGGLYLLRYRSAWASAAGAWQLIDLQHGIPVGDVDLSGNKLIVDADDDSWLQSTADDNIQIYAGANLVATFAFDGFSASQTFAGNSFINRIVAQYDELTISSGSISPYRMHHTVDTEGDASTDTLTNIDTANDGTLLLIRCASTSGTREVVVEHGTGNIRLAGDRNCVLRNHRRGLLLWCDGTNWYELFRSDEWNYEAAVATTSGATIDITGLHGATEIEIMFNGVSKNGSDQSIIQLGDSGGIETTGYVSASDDYSASSGSTAGFIVRDPSAAFSMTGVMKLRNYSGNIWMSEHTLLRGSNTNMYGSGIKELSGSLTQLRLTTISGANTFDAGEIIVRWK